MHVLVAELMRRRGFEALTTQEAGLTRQNDAGQLDYAASRGMVILTHNRNDFEVLHQSYITEDRSHAGIIIAVRHSPYELTRRLLRLLNAITADEIENQMVYI